MATKRAQLDLMKRVRAALKPRFDAARWTSGGYCLRNKSAVHRDGYRVIATKERDRCMVIYEQQYLLRPDMLGLQERYQMAERERSRLREYAVELVQAGFTLIPHTQRNKMPAWIVTEGEQP